MWTRHANSDLNYAPVADLRTSAAFCAALAAQPARPLIAITIRAIKKQFLGTTKERIVELVEECTTDSSRGNTEGWLEGGWLEEACRPDRRNRTQTQRSRKFLKQENTITKQKVHY